MAVHQHECDDDDDGDDVVPVAPPKKYQPAARSTFIHMEEVNDEDIYLHTSVAPSNLSRVLELSDGTDDSDDEKDCPPSLVTADDDDNDKNEVPEEPEESAEAELERLSKEWNLSIYVFFKQIPSITYIKDRRIHVFECAAAHCLGKGNGRMVRRYLDTGNAKSTSNLCKHAKICWGDEAVAAADNTKSIQAAREALENMVSVTSHHQHTTTEAHAEIVRWVAESKPPFQFVNDCGFQSLMKTGRPSYHIPSAETVSHDVKKIFVQAQKCIAKMLQEYDGC
ncbi:hypothetical protein BYT27DRAFT_7258037 [Phlegmacium glaucopus]|nr:hypothetical protein BYT27DRAFT_7258037 [Phlegmacium glaucopus]